MAPIPASLWWTRTYEPKERSDLSIATEVGHYSFPLQKIKILGCAMNRQEKTHNAVEESVQSANKAHWKDIMYDLQK